MVTKPGQWIPEPVEKGYLHTLICNELNNIYVKKNLDYGDSFARTMQEEGLATARIRLNDKLERFKKLSRAANEPNVKDESITDTLLDLANYAILTLIEMGYVPHGENSTGGTVVQVPPSKLSNLPPQHSVSTRGGVCANPSEGSWSL